MIEVLRLAVESFSDASLVVLVTIFALLLVSFARNVYYLFSFPRKCALDAPRHGNSLAPVNVFVFPGLLSSISGSPFSTKLLTYLRLTGIPFKIGKADMSKAPKGKFPFIEHHGHVIADTQLIIRYLEGTFDVGKMSAVAVKQLAEKIQKEKSSLVRFVPYDQMSAKDRAHCDLVRVACDEVLYWALISCRWLGTEGVSAREANWHATISAYFHAIPIPIRGVICAMIRKCVWTDAWGQGLSRHSPADQAALAVRLLSSLENSLQGRFVLGDAFMCEADCGLFGILNCLCEDTHWPNPLTKHIKENCPRLWEFNRSMRQQVFGDKESGDGFPADDLLDVKPVPAF